MLLEPVRLALLLLFTITVIIPYQQYHSSIFCCAFCSIKVILLLPSCNISCSGRMCRAFVYAHHVISMSHHNKPLKQLHFHVLVVNHVMPLLQGLLAWADVVEVYEQYKQQVIGLDDAVTVTQQLLESHATTTVQQVCMCTTVYNHKTFI
jgi:hypothetical protein